VIVFSQRGRQAFLKDGQRLKVQQVTIYGKSILSREKSEKALGRNGAAFSVAVADLLQAPDIEKIDLSEYTGTKQDKIYITLSEKFPANTVKVKIFNPDDSIQEEGEAICSNHPGMWIYTAKTTNDVPGDKIVIRAVDLAGFNSEEEPALNTLSDG
jgi:hypothetical protein